MAVFNNQLAGAAGQGGADAAYQIDRSVRLNSADSAHFSRTPSSAGNRKTWTWSGWVKRGKSALQMLFTCDGGTSNSTFGALSFLSTDQFQVTAFTTVWRETTAVYRDYSAWYHIVVAFDSTQATASNRVRIYINGDEVTDFNTSNDPALNTDYAINQAQPHNLGKNYGGYGSFDGYLADVHFIDGQALDPTDFGEYDSNNVWQPKAYSGTYGTNGFHLDFSDNSSNAALGDDSSGNNNDWTVNNLSIGTPYYRSQITGTVTDSVVGLTGPDYNYLLFNGSTSHPFVRANPDGTVTWTPESAYTGVSDIALYTYYPSGNTSLGTLFYVNGSLVTPTSKTQAGWTTLPVPAGGTVSSVGFGTSGSDYVFVAQIRINNVVITEDAAGNDSLIDTPTNYEASSGNNNGGNYATLNPLKIGSNASLANGNLDFSSSTVAGFSIALASIGVSSGKWYWEITPTNSGGNGYGIATDNVDLNDYLGGDANGWMYYDLNGKKYHNSSSASYGSTFTINDVIAFAFDADAGTITAYKNGTSQGVMYSGLSAGTYFPAVSDSAADRTTSASINFGQRPFAYTPPTGFLPLVTTSLSDPTIADGSTAMDVVTYTGTNTTKTITGLNFAPDFIWTKSRSRVDNHGLHDIVRGRASNLYSDLTAAENTSSTNADLVSFDSSGYTLGTVEQTAMNRSGETYVAWAWDAGSTTATNNNGSIQSTVRANPSAGFSIVSFTGNGTSGATVGHGLGAVPSMIIVKNRDITSNGYWAVRHISTGSGYLLLDLSNPSSAVTSVWSSTAPTSNVFSVGSSTTTNGTGNDLIAYCFAPVEGFSSFGSFYASSTTVDQFVYLGFRPKWLLIKPTATGSWRLVDATRSPYNGVDHELYPDLPNIEYDYGASADWCDFLSNGFVLKSDFGAATYVYAAFAEHPFKTARAR